MRRRVIGIVAAAIIAIALTAVACATRRLEPYGEARTPDGFRRDDDTLSDGEDAGAPDTDRPHRVMPPAPPVSF